MKRFELLGVACAVALSLAVSCSGDSHLPDGGAGSAGANDGCGASCGGEAGADEGSFDCSECDSSYQACNEEEARCDLLPGKCGTHLDCSEGENIKCGADHECGPATDLGQGCDCGPEYDFCEGTAIAVSIERAYDNGYEYVFASEDSEAVACGRFANGDYWVAPKPDQAHVVISGISVSGGTGGADVDPTAESQGFLASDYGNYDSTRNLLTEGGLPLSVSSSGSLVVGIQKDEATNGGCETSAIVGSCIDTYQVVTLREAPLLDSEGFLRPPVYGEGEVLTSLDALDLSRLPLSDLFPGTDAEGLERIRESWSHHLEVFAIGDIDGELHSEGGRAFRADLVTEEYAANMAQAFHRDLLTLLSNEQPVEDKLPAIAALATFGQDLFHALYDCSSDSCTLVRHCQSGAGQHIGKLPALALYAALHQDGLYAESLSAMAVDEQGGNACQEIEQVNTGAHGQGIWGDGIDDVGADLQSSLYRYWSAIVAGRCFVGAEGFDCNPNQGKKTSRDYYGYIDGPSILPGSAYFSVTSGVIRALAVEMMVFPELREAINYDVIIDYAARLKSSSEGVGVLVTGDECAPPDPRDWCSASDVTDASKTGCYGIPVGELHEDCGAWADRENCGYFGDGPNTNAAITTVTWGTEPTAVDLSDVTGKCVKNGTVWTKQGETWTSAPAVSGDPNYGQSGRFAPSALSAFEVGNRVPLAEDAFDEALNRYRASVD